MARALAIALAVLALLACTPEIPAGPVPTPTVRPESLAVLLPILTEAQAIEIALHHAAQALPEVNGGRDIGSPKARLMTLAEYEERFTSRKSSYYSKYYDRFIPVWVVTMEGWWEPAGIAVSPSATPTPYSYGVEVLDARTGEIISTMRSAMPIRLEEARGLNTAAYATYPLEVPLARARQLVDFPIFEPVFLPQGYSLARVRLELSHPLMELLSLPRYPRQIVVLEYTNRQGDIIQVAQSRAWLPEEVPGAARTHVGSLQAWERDSQGGPAWLAWQAMYPHHGPLPGAIYMIHFLYSESDSVTLGLLHEIAASLPAGGPLPGTPAPVPAPMAPPGPRPTSALAPTTSVPPGQQASGWPVSSTALIGRLDSDGLMLTTREGTEYRLAARCSQVETALRESTGRDVGLMVESDSVAPGATLLVLGVNPGGGIIPTCTDSSGRPLPLAPPAPPPEGR